MNPPTDPKRDAESSNELPRVEHVQYDLAGSVERNVERIDYAQLRGSNKAKEDSVRQQITFWLLGILAGTIAFSIVLVGFGNLWGADIEDVRSLMEVMFTAVVTLVSTAVGFYFGQRAREKSPDPDNEDEVG